MSSITHPPVVVVVVVVGENLGDIFPLLGHRKKGGYHLVLFDYSMVSFD